MGRGQPRKDPSKGLPSKSAGKSPKGGQGIQGKMATRSNGNKQKISSKNTGKGESSLAKKGGTKVPASDKKSKLDATKVKNVKTDLADENTRSKSTCVAKARFFEDDNAVELEVEGQATEFRSDGEDGHSEGEIVNYEE